MLHTDLIAPIPDLLRRHAAARGEKIAYRDAQTSVTYAGLLERTGKLAGHLADHGIAPGDTVAIMLPNSVQWVESCFAIARAGVIALMKSLAREFGRSGTTANTVSLGLVETPHDKDWVDANREKLVKLYPLRRLGLPEDVAPMIALLASPHSGWITGQVLSISGGYSMV